MQSSVKDISSTIKQNNWHGIIITNAAAMQICYLMNNNRDMIGLRLDIKQSGCAGLGYVIDKVLNCCNNDLVYENKGAKIFVNIKIMPLIDGTKIDYIKDGLNYFFKFYNPNAKYLCGCGESFGVLDDK